MKLLFLPHCLEKEISDKIYNVALEKNYQVYIVPGGSKVKKILDSYNPDEIERLVGIACEDEINLAGDYIKKIGFEEKTFSIQLSENGCENTKVDLEKVLDIL